MTWPLASSRMLKTIQDKYTFTTFINKVIEYKMIKVLPESCNEATDPTQVQLEGHMTKKNPRQHLIDCWILLSNWLVFAQRRSYYFIKSLWAIFLGPFNFLLDKQTHWYDKVYPLTNAFKFLSHLCDNFHKSNDKKFCQR